MGKMRYETKINTNLFINEHAKHFAYNGKHEIKRNQFEIGIMLGKGNFGCVCQGIAEGLLNSKNKMKVAIKTVNNELDVTQLHALMCEIRILDKLDMHLNLVNMVGACTTQFRSGQLWLLLEFCTHGNLKSFLRKNKETLKLSLHDNRSVNGINDRLFFKWAHNVAKGMEYLSSKKIMHGDLAARNILIGNVGNNHESYIAKISDFGLSRPFYNNIRYKKTERDNVPWKWMDIEYLETGEFTMKSDIWSFGIVLWEILSLGREPYPGAETKSTIDEIKAGYRLPCPEEVQHNKELVDLYHFSTQWCWQSNVELRWTFSDFVEYFETYLTIDEKEEYILWEKEYATINNLLNKEPEMRKDSIQVSQKDLVKNRITSREVNTKDCGSYHKFHEGLEVNPNSTMNNNLYTRGYILAENVGASKKINSNSEFSCDTHSKSIANDFIKQTKEVNIDSRGYQILPGLQSK